MCFAAKKIKLFVMSFDGLALEGLTVFYLTVLQAWQTLSFSREGEGSNQWVYEEPLFFNPLFSVELLSCATVRSAMHESPKYATYAGD